MTILRGFLLYFLETGILPGYGAFSNTGDMVASLGKCLETGTAHFINRLQDAPDMKTMVKRLTRQFPEATIEKILGRNHTATLTQYMTEYSDQISHLNQAKEPKPDMDLLRQSGSQLVTIADEFVTKEREAVNRMFKLAQRAPIYFTIILAAMLLGSSESVPVVNGELQLGTWQSVLFIELDGPRERSITLQLWGE